MAKALSARALETLRAGPTRREIPDGGSGLYFVVQPSGAKSWAFRYRHHRQPKKLTLGPYPLVPLADKRDERGRIVVKGARTLAGEARELAAQGRDPAGERVAKAADGPDRDLFPAAAKLFIERYARPNQRRWQETARVLGLVANADGELSVKAGGIAARWSNRRVQEVSRRDVIELLDRIMDSGAGVMANRTLSALRKFFNWLIQRDVIVASPCAGVKPPAVETPRQRVLTDAEIRWFWQSTEHERHPYRQIFQIMLLTGQREAEVAGMTESELDLKEMVWNIPGERTKNGDDHRVPLTKWALSIIDSRHHVESERGYLFTTNGLAPVNSFSKVKLRLHERMSKAASKAGAKIEPWTFHDLRRTMTTGMTKIGVDLPIAEKVINHKSGSFAGVVGVYQRYGYDKEKREALESWSRQVKAIVSGRTGKVRGLKHGKR
jgi:integrase